MDDAARVAKQTPGAMVTLASAFRFDGYRVLLVFGRYHNLHPLIHNQFAAGNEIHARVVDVFEMGVFIFTRFIVVQADTNSQLTTEGSPSFAGHFIHVD